MSHENHDSSKCAAYGCPMPGTRSHSTSGGSDWFCRFHFARDALEWQALSAELNRVSWLVDAVQAIRRYSCMPIWPAVYRNIKAAIKENMRSDLLNKADETALEWAKRLDDELNEICKGKEPMAPLAPVVDPGASDTWKKMEFEVPA